MRKYQRVEKVEPVKEDDQERFNKDRSTAKLANIQTKKQ